MLVRFVDAPMVPGGRAVVICDDTGKPLHGQIGSILECEVGQQPRITVIFEIDGKKIRMDG
jgi:hypothetical protein